MMFGFSTTIVVVGVLMSTRALAQVNSFQSSAGCPSSEEESEESDRIYADCHEIVQKAVYEGLHFGVNGVVSLRRKRESSYNITMAEKRVLGCYFHCAFGKFNSLEADDMPSRKGLVKIFLKDNYMNKGFTIALMQIVDECYSIINDFRGIHKNDKVAEGEVCDVTFNVYYCVSQKMDEYCDFSSET